MRVKSKKYIALIITVCIASYMLMCGFCRLDKFEALAVYDAEMGEQAKKVIVEPIETEPVDRLAEYVLNVSGLSYDDSLYMVDECERQKTDVFIVMGLVKKESQFTADALGSHGERGLGQLMENTAAPVARNLGIEYDRDRMFEPKYNLRLTITQLAYLTDIYGGDLNKALTSYNRGQQGLIDYIESGSSPYTDPAMSEYSVSVLKYAAEFKEEFEKFSK